MQRVIKRDGVEIEFDAGKIFKAIASANMEVPEKDRLHNRDILQIAKCVADIVDGMKRAVKVEEIQEIVETELMRSQAFDVAKRYIRYRFDHTLRRQSNTIDAEVMAIANGVSEEAKTENSNKNPEIASVQRDYIAGAVSKDITRRKLMPIDIMNAHDEGVLHFHDSDYFLQSITNCCLVNLADMLQNGTVISGTLIEKPHTFSTACNIATQIIAQVASSQYGGQSISLAHLAPFVDESRKYFWNTYGESLKSCGCDTQTSTEIIERMVKDDIKRGVQMIQYQVITLMTTNGQAPFVTVYMDINEVPDGECREDLALVIEEVLKQRLQGVKNECGVWISPAFPKLIYTLDDNNVYADSKYYYLTKLAAICTAKRMVPDYISAKVMRDMKCGHVFPCMGCRSFLSTYEDENGMPKYYGRMNQGVVTINLVDVALSSGGDENEFWKIFDERLELCHRALKLRHERLEGTLSDVAPIMWQYGALARLQKGEKIDKLLHGGYSTISLGYAGLSECTYYMKGESHTGEEGEKFALAVMRYMNTKTEQWKDAEDVGYSLYGTPLESTTYKFAQCLQKRFGIIPNVTDKNYITNSYHIKVTEEIDAFSKLTFESKFQALSPGGAISYVEVPNMTGNIPAVIAVLQHIYENIMYAELNTKSDYCHECGFDGEIRIVTDDSGKLVWECPKCGNRNQNKMNVTRRTCGYLGTNFWNQGRTQEIKDRVLHL